LGRVFRKRQIPRRPDFIALGQGQIIAKAPERAVPSQLPWPKATLPVFRNIPFGPANQKWLISKTMPMANNLPAETKLLRQLL
jgi:hypothetical protein